MGAVGRCRPFAFSLLSLSLLPTKLSDAKNWPSTQLGPENIASSSNISLLSGAVRCPSASSRHPPVCRCPPVLKLVRTPTAVPQRKRLRGRLGKGFQALCGAGDWCAGRCLHFRVCPLGRRAVLARSGLPARGVPDGSPTPSAWLPRW